MRSIASPSWKSPVLLVVFCLLISVLVFSSASPQQAFGVTSAEKKAEAEALFQSIDALQSELNAVNADYLDASSKHEAAIKAAEEAGIKLAQTQSRIDSLQGKLADRAVEMYKGGSFTFLDVILDSASFDEFLSSWDMAQRIANKNAALITESKDLREQARVAQEEQQKQAQIASEEMKRASTLQQQIESTQSELREQALQVTAEAAELQAQEELQAEEARKAVEASAALESQIIEGSSSSSSSAPSSSTSYSPGPSINLGSGTLANPCPAGTLSSSFGYRTFDNSFHKGIDLAASTGTPYYAAESGTVMYATNGGGYNGGAGNWIVISHGNGMVTKYMHSSVTYVKPGDYVTRGQNIGAVGNTGQSFGSHLHFQVEINGTAVNPFLLF